MEKAKFLTCNNCDRSLHVKCCAGLNSVSKGDWLCDSCLSMLSPTSIHFTTSPPMNDNTPLVSISDNHTIKQQQRQTTILPTNYSTPGTPYDKLNENDNTNASRSMISNTGQTTPPTAFISERHRLIIIPPEIPNSTITTIEITNCRIPSPKRRSTRKRKCDAPYSHNDTIEIDLQYE
ncbi:unnamed protein product [Absidia cylindrospora]